MIDSLKTAPFLFIFSFLVLKFLCTSVCFFVSLLKVVEKPSALSLYLSLSRSLCSERNHCSFSNKNSEKIGDILCRVSVCL